jgi:3-deoxy-manno-octulosonate cytidylyltransferase (CMP-KDO synthetase)
MPDPRVAVVSPARYDSTRFPGKVLAPLCGRPMIAHVIERARAATLPALVLVATDDPRIAAAAAAAGARVHHTGPHPSGTDRVAEAARALNASVIVNLQGDEPLIPLSAIDRVAEPLLGDKALDMVTLAHRVDEETARDPNLVKVVCDRQSNALYFSRQLIPYIRDRADSPHVPSGVTPPTHLGHIGIYAFRRDVLLTLSRTPPTPLERSEGLEQLRALELGYAIRVELVDWAAHGVDTPADLERAEALFRAGAPAGSGG